MPSKLDLAVLAASFAVPGTALAAQTPTIIKALERAAVVRAGNIQPPGHWKTGVMLPRLDGKMNYDGEATIPNRGPRVLFIGGNGG